MLGNLRYGLNLDDSLWTALEVRPARYAFEFEVKARPAEGEWSILQVYLDDSLVHEQEVRTRDWTVATIEARFEADGCHRLLLAFDNDLYKIVDGRELNRNLYFRQVTIRELPDR
jgi:hypothetical protein